MDTSSAIFTSSVLFPFVFGAYIGFNEWEMLLPVVCTSLLSYLLTSKLIPSLKNATRAAGLFGEDMNKSSSKKM